MKKELLKYDRNWVTLDELDKKLMESVDFNILEILESKKEDEACWTIVAIQKELKERTGKTYSHSYLTKVMKRVRSNNFGVMLRRILGKNYYYLKEEKSDDEL